MKDTYILLKDFPGCERGDVFIWNNSHFRYQRGGNVQEMFLFQNVVENNPEWFAKEEVKAPVRVTHWSPYVNADNAIIFKLSNGHDIPILEERLAELLMHEMGYWKFSANEGEEYFKKDDLIDYGIYVACKTEDEIDKLGSYRVNYFDEWMKTRKP